MAVREIVQVGDPVLRQEARSLAREELATDEIRQLIADMRDTMRAAPGVGLAAPQIGVSLQLVVIEDPAEFHTGFTPEQLAARERAPVPFHVLVNPRLTIEGNETVPHFEGCLSFSAFHMIVSRARKVRVDALDETGAPISRSAVGWYARILQHEVDHLRGVVCCDRMDPRTLSTPANYSKHYAGKTIVEAKAIIGKAPR
ncbi:MAG: peptide deformylase [Deltaproteobacteria bacterium]|nr:peptide deformylase [Deltaproteobacteria bacterium]